MNVIGQSRRCVPSVTSEFPGPLGSEVCDISVNEMIFLARILGFWPPWESSIGVKKWELQGSSKASRVPS